MLKNKFPMQHFPNLLLLFLFLSLAACNRKTKTASIPPIPPAPVDSLLVDGLDTLTSVTEPPPLTEVEGALPLLEYQKDFCYGNCAVFELQICADGTCQLLGIKDIPWIGKYEGHLNEGQQGQLKAYLRNLQMENWASSYPVNGPILSDLPVSRLTLFDALPPREITLNYEIPKSLQSFQQYLDQLVRSTDWKEKP